MQLPRDSAPFDGCQERCLSMQKSEGDLPDRLAANCPQSYVDSTYSAAPIHSDEEVVSGKLAEMGRAQFLDNVQVLLGNAPRGDTVHHQRRCVLLQTVSGLVCLRGD